MIVTTFPHALYEGGSAMLAPAAQPTHLTKWERWFLALSSVAIFLLILVPLLWPPALGAADNGDYQRLAHRVGIDGVEYYSGNPWPYFTAAYSRWDWQPMPWASLTPFQAASSTVWPVSLVRLVTNLLGDTATAPFQTYHLCIVYAIMLTAALTLLERFVLLRLHGWSLPFLLLAALMLLDSMHLCWLNSLYSEAMIFIGLLLTMGCAVTVLSTPPGSRLCLIMTVLSWISGFLLVTSKPQVAVAWPFVVVFLLFLTRYAIKPLPSKRLAAALVAFQILWSGSTCFELYRWNNAINEEATLFSAIFDGLLTLTDDPEGMLADLGLDPIMASDKGKTGYDDHEQMVAPPYSAKGREMIYDRIDTFGLLRYYITHPALLIQALDITCRHAAAPAVELHRQMDQPPTEESAARINLWAKLRPHVMPNRLWQYALCFGAALAYCLVRLRKDRGQQRLLAGLMLSILLIGLEQLPLPFIGNGLADTNKQLYLFMLVCDLSLLSALFVFLGHLRQKYSFR